MCSFLSWLARASCAVALLLAFTSSAFAGGRTFNLSTLAKRGGVALRPGEKAITVRAPKGSQLNKTFAAAFRPIPGKSNKAGTATLFRVTQGAYQIRGAASLRFSVLPEGNIATAPPARGR